VEAPQEKRRDDFVEPYLKNGAADRVAVILKAREPARILTPFRGDRILANEKRCKVDRLYQRISDDLDALFRAVGLKSMA